MTKNIAQIIISGTLVNDPQFYNLKNKSGKLSALFIKTEIDNNQKRFFRVLTNNPELQKIVMKLKKNNSVTVSGSPYPKLYNEKLSIEVSADNIIIN